MSILWICLVRINKELCVHRLTLSFVSLIFITLQWLVFTPSGLMRDECYFVSPNINVYCVVNINSN